jgi:hypothetical protein
MFLHERTRINLCRLLFVGLCLAPTLAALAAALWLRQPAHRRAVEQEIAQALGVDVSTSRVSYPLPGVIRLVGLELSDPRTRRVVASANRADAQRADSGWLVALDKLELHSDVAAGLTEWVEDALRRPPTAAVRLVASEAIWRLDEHPAGDEPVALLRLQAGFDAAADGASQAYLTFALADQVGADSVRARVLERRDPHAPRYDVQFHTGEARVPCRWLAPLGVEVEWLGHDATFRGSAFASQLGGEWQTQLFGRLTQVDLQAVMASCSPHVLTGLAEIEIPRPDPARGVSSLVLRGRRIERASATVIAGPGLVGRSLLNAARSLQLPSTGSPIAVEEQAPQAYDQLAFDVALGARGVQLRGRSTTNGAIMIDGKGVLIGQSRGRQPIGQLVEMLTPATRSVMPGTSEAQRLARHLPLPAADERMVTRPADTRPTTQR